MAKKKLTPEQEKEIKYLQANNEMLEKTKEEAKLRGTENAVKRIELAQQDVYEQMAKIDASIAKKMITPKKDTIEINQEVYIKDNETIFDALEKASKNTKENLVIEEEKTTVEDTEIEEPKIESTENNFNNIDSDVQYDIISLPSNGECYKNKVSRIPVGYLTAYDENFITSPNLYKDGLIIDFLLKNKIMNKNINIDELCSGDVDAIILFLRATSYGPDFPIMVTDPETGEQIESVADLSKLKYKEFTLKGDKNGYFDYTLPLSKDVVKFRFLTRNDEKKLVLLNNLESNSAKANLIINDISDIKEAIKFDKILTGKEKQEFISNLTKINTWAKGVLEEKPNPYTKMITNRMELSIVSINGNEDRQFIANYVRNMNARDSIKLRRYIIENEPGVNFEIEVERPESLGGGSFKTFLEWNDSVFLNIG